jgi:hypothetical protein
MCISSLSTKGQLTSTFNVDGIFNSFLRFRNERSQGPCRFDKIMKLTAPAKTFVDSGLQGAAAPPPDIDGQVRGLLDLGAKPPHKCEFVSLTILNQ